MNIIINNYECHKPRPARLAFKFALPQPKERTVPMPVEVTLTNEQKVRATITPVTATGKPAQLDGNPALTVISGSATIANVSADGRSFDIVSPDEPGDSQILVEADADLGAGVETISDTIRVAVIGARATNLGLTVGAPEPK